MRTPLVPTLLLLPKSVVDYFEGVSLRHQTPVNVLMQAVLLTHVNDKRASKDAKRRRDL